MGIGLFMDIILALLCFLFLYHLSKNSQKLPTNWPLVGMLPALLGQLSRINEWIAELVVHHSLQNFLFRGPWLCNMDMFLTVDPANIHYIMSSNFANYPKGSELREMFAVFGNAIFNSDGETWKDQRRAAVSLVNHRKFQNFSARTSREKIRNGLIPILDRAAREGSVVDLQDLFQRLSFDSICKSVTGFDPESLSEDFPDVPFAKALDDADEAVFFRHIVPEFVWKLQRRLGIGLERKLSHAWETFDRVIGEYVETRRKEIEGSGEFSRSDSDESDLLTSYMIMERDERPGAMEANEDKFHRDTILSLILAGRDTTTSALAWFFYKLYENPSIEAKILEEINSLATDGEEVIGNRELVDKMVYVHGAICETLRLYPPVPFQHKSPIKSDILPSGHEVRAHSRILFSLYGMARVSSVWGKDCSEFRPERWISNKGTMRHEPSYKFMSFNAGPRTCLGKDVAMTQMKSVVASIVRDFHFEVEPGQDISPCTSIILRMKHGLKVRVSRRSI